MLTLLTPATVPFVLILPAVFMVTEVFALTLPFIEVGFAIAPVCDSVTEPVVAVMLPFSAVLPPVLRITVLPDTLPLIVVDEARVEAKVSAPLVPSELTTTAPLLASFTLTTPDVEFADKLFAVIAKADAAAPMLPVLLCKATVAPIIEELLPSDIFPVAVVNDTVFVAFKTLLAFNAIPPEPLLVLIDTEEPSTDEAAIVTAVAD